MKLDAAARRRYARQLLLGEIGEAGQERLLEAGFRRCEGGDADATAAAVEYLERAGCPVNDRATEARVPEIAQGREEHVAGHAAEGFDEEGRHVVSVVDRRRLAQPAQA